MGEIIPELVGGIIPERRAASPESVLEHVGTEMALHVLAYNMKRVMRILGVGGLMEAIRA